MSTRLLWWQEKLPHKKLPHIIEIGTVIAAEVIVLTLRIQENDYREICEHWNSSILGFVSHCVHLLSVIYCYYFSCVGVHLQYCRCRNRVFTPLQCNYYNDHDITGNLNSTCSLEWDCTRKNCSHNMVVIQLGCHFQVISSTNDYYDDMLVVCIFQ